MAVSVFGDASWDLLLARLLLLGTLCVAPWLFGGVEPHTQVLLFAGVCGSLALWTVSILPQIRRRGSLRLPTVLVPVASALLLGSIQLMPLFAQQPGSPANSTVEGLVRESTPTASIYPASTRYELARVSVAFVALLMGAVLFQTRQSQVWLWGILALNGAALAFFGIVQQLSWNGKLYWIHPLLKGGQPFASYVNRNNAAGYLNLCVAAAVGLCVWSCFDELSHREGSGGNFPSRNPRDRLMRFLGKVSRLNALNLAAFSILAFMAAGIVCSLSRGGMLALAVTTLVATGLLVRSGRWVGILGCVVAIALASFWLISWLELTDGIGKRWGGGLTDFAHDSRLANWPDAMRVIPDFPLLGTGFGTYRYAYQPYESRYTAVWFYNADNQFLEGWVEGGIVGLGLMLAAIALTIIAATAYARGHRMLSQDPVALVGLWAILSQCVSAFFDFGPALVANMLTLAVLVGAVTGRVARHAGSTGIPKWLALPHMSTGWTAAVGAILLGHSAMALREVHALATLRDTDDRVPELRSADSLPGAQLTELIDRRSGLLKTRPDDAETHQELADLLIYRYRQQAFVVLSQQTDGNRFAWNLTDPAVLYAKVQTLVRSGQGARINELQKDPLIRDNLVAARLHLVAAQRACPLMPKIDLQLAMLDFLANSTDPTGEAHLRRAVAVTPTRPDVLFLAGFLAHVAGLDDLSNESWRSCLRFDPQKFPQIEKLLGKLPLQEQIRRILPESPEFLLALANQKYAGEGQRAERHLLAEQAEGFLHAQQARLPAAEYLRLLAQVRSLQDRNATAEELFRQALQLAPLNVEWRFQFAQQLRQRGRLKAACAQAEACVSLSPERPEFRKLLAELRLQVLRRPSDASDPEDSDVQ